jgi:hypothetical protein
MSARFGRANRANSHPHSAWVPQTLCSCKETAVTALHALRNFDVTLNVSKEATSFLLFRRGRCQTQTR